MVTTDFMQYQKVIEQLGYTAKEAKVYLAALKLGEAHISDIAASVNLPRTSVQTIVDRLQADGLMNFYVMRRYKYWVAADPKQLLKKLKQQEEDLQASLPALVELRQKARRKVSQKNRHQNYELAKTFAQTATQPMLLSNEAAVIVHVNPAWEQQFGYTAKEVVGKSTKLLASGKTPPHVYERMWRALERGRLFQTDEVIDKRKDGSFFCMRTSIFALQFGSEKCYVQVLQEIPGSPD